MSSRAIIADSVEGVANPDVNFQNPGMGGDMYNLTAPYTLFGLGAP